MTLRDCGFLLRSLSHLGPLMALLTIGAVWCGGFISLITVFQPSRSLAGKINFLCYFSWLPLTLTSFFRAILQGPGFSPLKWRPKNSDDEQFLQFCRVCDGFKPPRAHHCRRCARCCLKMDHHCIWLSKCVGYNNQASFLVFLFGAVFGAFHATIMIINFSYQQLWIRLTMNPNVVLAVMISSGFGIGTVIAVGVLLYQQIRILLRNKTGIESWIVEKANWRRKEILNIKEKYSFPYDLGWRRNFWEVFGSKPESNGCFYPVIEGASQFSLTVEQKLQKALKKEKAVRFRCVQSYSGRTLPILSFPRSVIYAPLCDDTLSLQKGEDIIITRGRKHWFYGYKPDDISKRGFVPKSALKEVQFEEISKKEE